MTAQIGYGTKFKRAASGSPSEYSSVGEVTSITAPGLSRDAVETTHMESTERWRTFISGLKDGGEVNIEINFDPSDSSTTDFLNDLNTDANVDYQIEWRDGTLWTFNALMTGMEPGVPIDDRITANCTFKVSGKPYFIA